jgi:transposase-like protein
LTSKKHELEHDVKLDVEARVRQGVKAVLEEVLQEEMTQHLEAGYRELTPTRRGARNGYYQRNLVTSGGQDRTPGGAQGPRGRVCHGGL